MATKKNSGDAGEAEVQSTMDEVTEKGYLGDRTDPTPLENYTVSGVTSGAPTPETDKGARLAAQEHQENLAASVTETGTRS